MKNNNPNAGKRSGLSQLKLDPSVFKELSTTPLSKAVFETLREAILNGTLLPGEHLMEVQVAEQLGVSRTPVRESIRKLELEGLLDVVPRKGAYVTLLSKEDLREMMELRSVLEALAAKLATTRATPEQKQRLVDANRHLKKAIKEDNVEEMMKNDRIFHETLYEASGNTRLRAIIQSLHEQMHRTRVIYVDYIEDKMPLVTQHEKIVDAILGGDGDRAYCEARTHINSTHTEMLKVLTEKNKIG